jgi:hypothetical protein
MSAGWMIDLSPWPTRQGLEDQIPDLRHSPFVGSIQKHPKGPEFNLLAWSVVIRHLRRKPMLASIRAR